MAQYNTTQSCTTAFRENKKDLYTGFAAMHINAEELQVIVFKKLWPLYIPNILHVKQLAV